MLKGKNVLLCVTGSIAAYKIAELASRLVKKHCNVDVIMTKNATNFINPITFETLTGNKCIVDTFDRNFQFNVEHVSLAKKADCVMVAPASADIIGKMANGIADDMLTTTVLACRCKIMVSPAMNTNMYDNAIVQDNIKKLAHYGMEIIEPDSGYLACGDTGKGKMPSPEVLEWYILREIAKKKDMKGMNVCVTAGPTREIIDPVRFISNNSTGKMGYAIATEAASRGAEVVLVSGITNIKAPENVKLIKVESAREMQKYITLISGKVNIAPVPFVKLVDVISAKDMYDEVVKAAEYSDIIIKAAAVADYRPAVVSDNKIKKKDGDMSIELTRTEDIIGTLGKNKKKEQFLCGFSMETENMLENSKAKLDKKNLDMIVANNVKVKGAGFGTDTNVVTIITRNDCRELPIMSKEEVADEILSYIMQLKKEKH